MRLPKAVPEGLLPAVLSGINLPQATSLGTLGFLISGIQ